MTLANIRKRYATPVRFVTFSDVKTTRFPDLSYQRQGDCWRLLDNENESRPFGPFYSSQADLLAGLDQFASESGYA